MPLSSHSSTLSPIFLASLAPWKMYWGFQICVYLYNVVTNWRGWWWRQKVTAQGASRSVLCFRFWLHVTHNHGCGVLWACNCSSCHIPDSALPPGIGLWNDLHWRGKWSFQQVCCASWGARGWRRQAHVHNMAGKQVLGLSMYAKGRKWGSSRLRSLSLLLLCFTSVLNFDSWVVWGRLWNIQLKTHNLAGETGMESNHTLGSSRILWMFQELWGQEQRMTGFTSVTPHNEHCEAITEEATFELGDGEDFAGKKTFCDTKEEFWKEYWGVYCTPAGFTPPIILRV